MTGDAVSIKRNGRRGNRSLITHHGSLVFAVGLLVGCAIPHVPSRIIYEDPVNFVRLEEDPGVLPEWPPSHHAHPAAMGPERLRVILSGLFVQEHRASIQKWFQGDAPVMPVFKDDDVAWLATQIADALAQAKWNERVTFYLSQPQTSTKRVITTGGVYIKDSTFHLVLGNWRQPKWFHRVLRFGERCERRIDLWAVPASEGEVPNTDRKSTRLNSSHRT